MKGKKGICLILCLLLLTGLAPLRAAAVTGEQVDGVWASVALTGGANKIIFSADSEIEQQILSPNEQTPAHLILPEGIAYDAASNTLSLTDFHAPTANLVLTMMGGDFKIRLSGSSELASICSESMGRGGSVTICGDGALELAGTDNAILVRAGGAPDFVRVEPQVRLTASSSGSVIRVYDTSLSDGAIIADTSEPQVLAYDDTRLIESVTTTEGKTLEPYTRPGNGGLFGIKDDILSDAAGDRIVYNVYLLGDRTEDGLYPVLEEIEHNTEDISAYQRARTPHDWILVRLSNGATATQVRFARFTISTQVLGDGGTLSASQTEVARGGSVELSAVPWEGYKLVSLTINGEQVNAASGSYVIGGITADQAVTASFAAALPSRVVVTAPAVTDFKVPAKGAAGFLSEPFTAIVADGAGDPVGADVRWSIAPEAVGVSIDSDGRVTVSPTALEAAAEGTRTFTVTASTATEGLTLSNSEYGFTVSLAERRAAEVCLVRDGEKLGESDSLTIPAAGGTTRQQYAAIVYDQYGALRAEEIVWSAGDWPLGVRRDGDTLTVSDSCRDGSSLVVTAKCASDNAVAASVTVRFTAPPQESKESAPSGAKAAPGESAPSGAKGDPGEGDASETPVIIWPTVTLATTANPNLRYGVAWKDLVSLGDDGSATLGGADIEGVFSINKDPNALPNVSDSFKIVFTYTDGEESLSVESEAQTVTLLPGVITADMVTLSPTSTVYTGSAIEPTITVQDGERELSLDTDYAVTGYSNNIAAGDATVTIDGQGNYVGTVTKGFVITRRELNDNMITLSPEQVQYAYGAECRPAVIVRDGTRTLISGTDYTVTGYSGNTQIGNGSVSIAGQGNYSGTPSKGFTITPIPASVLTVSVTSCKPEDEGIKPTIVFKHGDLTLTEGTDYDLSLQYDIPTKTGTATAAFKGVYSGSRSLTFDLPNYLITEGAGGSWTKGTTVTLNFKANGAFGKFTELTVDGKTVPKSYYSAASGSTVILIKPDYLKTLTAGKHIVGVVYKDGKALAIFSIVDIDRRGVPTGDGNNTTAWVILLAASLIAFGSLAFAFVRSGQKKKKKRRKQ